MQTQSTTRQTHDSNKRGVVALELILVFPILMILLLAVVEFGLILAASNHVEAASRLGAKLAAEAANLDQFNDPNTLENLKLRVDEYLNTAGYTDSCQVILENTVPGTTAPTQENPTMASNCPCTPVIGATGTLPVRAVRVTVCLNMTGNVPNCLATFGFDISGRVIRHSVTWIYEEP